VFPLHCTCAIGYGSAVQMYSVVLWTMSTVTCRLGFHGGSCPPLNFLFALCVHTLDSRCFVAEEWLSHVIPFAATSRWVYDILTKQCLYDTFRGDGVQRDGCMTVPRESLNRVGVALCCRGPSQTSDARSSHRPVGRCRLALAERARQI
jgi:hypothetical protein